jgi:glycosyltransferase involved in cell wall biosynthesis
MRVFVALYDVESTTGGGQTIYHQIFRRYPQIQFTYLLDREPVNYPRPANVRGLRPGRRYVRNADQNSLMMDCFCWAKTIAATMRGHSFDVVDIPDFMSDFCLLPAALLHQGSRATIVVALHGQSSRTLELEWPPAGRLNPERVRVEKLLFGSSDARYGISQDYLDDWMSVCPLGTQFVNPLAWLPVPAWQPPIRATHAPDLYFVGRTERRKGPDLFLEAIWRLSRDAYRESTIIGASVPITNDLDSNTYLRHMVRSRQLNTTVTGKKTSSQLLQIFASRSVVILPSRYDTLNLVALEALMAGCPVMIGTAAGVCRFLTDHLPSIPFARFDLNDLEAAVRNLSDLLSHYDETRKEISDALEALPKTVPLPDLESIYSPRDHDHDLRMQAIQLFEDLERREQGTRPTLVRRARKWIARSRRLTGIALALQRRRSPDQAHSTTSRPVWFAWKNAKSLWQGRRRPDGSRAVPRTRSTALRQTTHLFGRRQLWIEMSSQQPDVALASAAYALRAMRISGGNSDGLLARTTSTLNAAGFHREANLAELMYADQDESVRRDRLTAWLRARHAAAMAPADIPMDVSEDRRGTNEPRVSIVVAIDDTNPAQPGFWQQLNEQSLIRRHQAEVVIVRYRSLKTDHVAPASGPANREVIDSPLVSLRLHSAATRSQAWNQGLKFARAQYVTLLTVHEAFRPFALELLAGELDSRRDVDWMQPHTLMTECDSAGHYVGDLAYYDRNRFDAMLVGLDMQAVTRAGALYRRQIHNDCGYFDPDLRLTGDLEFVQRAAPRIRIAPWPQTLSLIARVGKTDDGDPLEHEIELLQAWDVFRTSAGIDTAFAARLERLPGAVRLAWAYRPTISKQLPDSTSSDVEYAARLAAYSTEKGLDMPEHCARQLIGLCNLYRRLERVGTGSWMATMTDWWRAWNAIHPVRRRLAISLGNPPPLAYFQDERFERDRYWIDNSAMPDE